MAMWHLRSLKPLSFPEFDTHHENMFVPNVCRIYDNQVRVIILSIVIFIFDLYVIYFFLNPNQILNQIITGGNSDRLFFHTFECKLKTEIATSINCVYEIVVNSISKTNKILSASGNSSLIDICSNLSYKALTLNF